MITDRDSSKETISGSKTNASHIIGMTPTASEHPARTIGLVSIGPAASLVFLVIHLIRANWNEQPFVLAVAAVYLALLTAGLVYTGALLLRLFKIRRTEKPDWSGLFTTPALISWLIFQSGCLLLSFFSDQFQPGDRQAYWLGIGALLIVFAVSQTGFCWLEKRFRH